MKAAVDILKKLMQEAFEAGYANRNDETSAGNPFHKTPDFPEWFEGDKKKWINALIEMKALLLNSKKL